MTQQVQNLSNKKIAILATDGFEEIELTSPLEELKSDGAEVQIVSEKEKIRSWKNREWGQEFEVDRLLEKANVNDYDALIIPGGVINPDRLRRNKEAIAFIQAFDKQKKLIASICHGPQLLIEAGLVKGKEITGYHSIRTDLINAGGKYEDTAVVVDGNLLTSRKPDDIPSFLKKIIGILKVEDEYME